jgi:hypothetical protein
MEAVIFIKVFLVWNAVLVIVMAQGRMAHKQGEIKRDLGRSPSLYSGSILKNTGYLLRK